MFCTRRLRRLFILNDAKEVQKRSRIFAVRSSSSALNTTAPCYAAQTCIGRYVNLKRLDQGLIPQALQNDDIDELKIRDELCSSVLNDKTIIKSIPPNIWSILLAAGVIKVAGASWVAKMRSSILRVALLLAGVGVIDGERACVSLNSSVFSTM